MKLNCWRDGIESISYLPKAKKIYLDVGGNYFSIIGELVCLDMLSCLLTS